MAKMKNKMKVKVKTQRPAPTWSDIDMRNAVELIKNDQISYRKASAQFNIPISTLALKVKGWKGTKRDRKPTLEKNGERGRKFVIPADDEKNLANSLKIMNKWGFGLGKAEVLNTVKDFIINNGIKNPFTDNKPGNGWFKSFCTRYNLSLKKPEIVESSRARQANDPFIVKNFFKILSSTIRELGLSSKPELIYNCDESGFKNDPTTSKIVAEKGSSAKRITGGNARSSTTVLACVNAVGNKLAPLILHKGKRLWDNMMGDIPYPGTSYSVSENGWMTEKVFNLWFKDQFLPKLQEKPVLLLYDGHLSHISLDLVKIAIEASVTILKLPPHTSHILQPLDVSVFKGVKSRWDSKLAEWTRHNYGKTLPKSTFANILGSVWTDVTPEVIRKGFEKTGIFPFNENKIPDSTFDPEKLARFRSSMQEITLGTASEPLLTPPLTTNGADIGVLYQDTSESEVSQSVQNSNRNNKTFEEILLQTVSPSVNVANKRKKVRIDDAEIITNEAYLAKLQKIEDLKEKEIERKSKVKLDKEKAKTAKELLKISQRSKVSKEKSSNIKFPKKKFEKRNTF